MEEIVLLFVQMPPGKRSLFPKNALCVGRFKNYFLQFGKTEALENG